MERATGSGRPTRAGGPARSASEPRQRYRLTIRRTASAPPLPQREYLAAWEAALIASALPVAGLDGSGGHPKLAFAAPLPVGMAAERELADLLLTRRVPAAMVRERLEAHLPEGHEILGIEDVWLGRAPLAGGCVGATYEATIEPGAKAGGRELSTELGQAAARLLEAESLPRHRSKGGSAAAAYDLRPLVGDLRVEVRDEAIIVVITTRILAERGVGRPDEVLAELARAAGLDSLPVASVRRTRVILHGES